MVEVDPSTALAKIFKVELKNGRWVIPSHYDYPADAKDRLARTAGRVVGLTKDTIRSSRTEDHSQLGVIDPMSAKLSTIEGVGKRITLRDSANRVLADYIIGKEVKGHPDQKYVRRAGQEQVRTYGVKMTAEPSTRFADWIETNLLKLDAAKLRSVEIDTTKVDDNKRIREGDVVDLTRKDASAPWTTEGLPPTEEVDPAKMSSLVSTLGDLKIVGVRPKPAGLTAELKATGGEGGLKIDKAGQLSLQDRGFYFDRSGQLYSDEGGMIASTDEGVTYILKFGKVIIAKDDALSAGSTDEASADALKKKDKDKDKEKAASEDTGESRFLFVSVRFRPELIAKPESMKPEGASELPDNLFQRTPDQIAADKSKADREKAQYEAKLKEGKDRAAELSARFAPWYYVVPGAAYRSLVMDRAALVHPKAPPGRGPNPGGFPPGMGGADPFGGFSPPPRGMR